MKIGLEMGLEMRSIGDEIGMRLEIKLKMDWRWRKRLEMGLDMRSIGDRIKDKIGDGIDWR